MKVRIPGPVNRALDAVGRSGWTASALVSTAAVALLVVAFLEYRTAAGVVGAVLAVAFLVGHYQARLLQLRELIRQREYDLAAERRENARLRQGDPSAPTTQLRPIGDRGEPL